MIIKDLALLDYQACYAAMRQFTAQRTRDTEDELWLLEHPAVFTQGLNGKAKHILANNDIPIVQTDRGGQVTYHGPGQLIVYTLIDLKRCGIGVREMVTCLENSVISLLSDLGIVANACQDAPGVYVNGSKIAALGLRIKRGACYHGLSLNVNMDLSPFTLIDPCGYPELPVIDLTSLGFEVPMAQIKQQLGSLLTQQLEIIGNE